MVTYQLRLTFYILRLWNGKKHGRVNPKMAKAKKPAKLTFISIIPDNLKDLELNTIPQVTTALSYVLKWGKLKTVIENLPEDHKNVIAFFKGINKLSPQKFQPQKFKDLWTKHDMEDITDYKLQVLGISDEEDEEYAEEEEEEVEEEAEEEVVEED